MASDNGDAEYPIFREPSSTDPGKTVATGINYTFLYLRQN